MFPLISKNHSKGYKYIHYFNLSLILTLLICFGAVIIYAVFPNLAIKMLFGSVYLEGAPYLIWFAVFIAIYTLAQLFISFFLSINKTNITYFSLVAVIIQFVGINIFHSSVLEVIKISTLASSFLLIVMVIYFLNEKAHGKIS
ncbi:MAG: polysaccharide biosynthesis protein [uncultured bacterium]|nr:MAG: polysaccharide biosynthesis protein [uncultured bacterium]